MAFISLNIFIFLFLIFLLTFSYSKTSGKTVFFKKTAFYLILGLVGAIPLIWFKDGLIVTGGDNTFSYLGFRRKFNLPTTWDDYADFGFYTRGLHHIIYSNLTNVFNFLPDSVFQMLLFSFLFFVRLLIYYKLLNLIFSKEKNKVLFLPAVLLFALNPYFLLDPISLIGFLVPIQMSLIFIFVYKFLHQNKINFKYLILISIINPPLFSNVAALSGTYIPGGLYFIFNLLLVKKRLRLSGFLKRIFCVGLIFTGLNLWYLIPIAKSFLEISSIASTVNSFRAMGSGYLYDHFRLIGKWSWYSGHYLYPYFPFAQNYYRMPLLFFTFGITLFSLFLLFVLPKKRVFHKNERKVFYYFSLLFIFGLFLTNGSKSPLGKVYMAIYNSIPIFWMFREPFTKFTPLIVFSLPVLLYGSLLYFYRVSQNKRLFKIIYSMVVVAVIINSYPIFTGEVIWNKWNGSMRSFRVQVPGYWRDIKEYIISHNLEKHRLLIFPASKYGMAYNWHHGLSSPDDVAVYLLPNSIVRHSSYPLNNSDLLVNQLFSKLADKDFNLREYLGLLNTRYVLQENDVDWRYSSGKMLPPSKSSQILQNHGLTKVIEFGKFTPEYLSLIPNNEPDKLRRQEMYQELEGKPALVLYKMDDQYFLPHFYIPQNIIYSPNGIEILPEIVGMPGYKLRSAIYPEGKAPNHKSQIPNKLQIPNSKFQKDKEILDRADEILVAGKGEGVTSRVLETEWNEGWAWPEASVAPGSWLYPLVRLKERWVEWRAKGSLGKADMLLWHGVKRIEEIQKFKNMEVKRLVDDYLENLGRVEEILQAVPKEERDDKFWGMVTKTLAYMKRAEGEMGKLEGLSYLDWIEIEGLRDNFRAWVKHISDSWCPEGEYCYKIDLPESGEYEVFVDKRTEGVAEGRIKIVGGGQEMLKPLAEQKEENWESFGKLDLERGKGYRFSLALQELPNLVSDQGWEAFEGSRLGEEGLELSPQAVFGDSVLRSQPIKGWKAGEKYRISFEYRAKSGRLGVAVLEERVDYEKLGKEGVDYQEVKNDKEVIKTKKFFGKELQASFSGYEGYKEGGGWEQFETELTAGYSARGARLFVYAVPEEGKIADVRIRNVKVQKILEPKLLLKKERAPHAGFQGSKMPKIKFVRINPTKYLVKVEGATEPYTLVFSESYHSGWKIYADNAGKNTDNADGETRMTPMGVVGKVASKVTGLFLKNKGYGEEVASYFDGDIKEGTHQMTFLEPATFETWGKKPIAENRHYLVNGYANSWYIKPSDVGGRENYELVVEFWPQRLFYIGLFISLITLMVSLIMLMEPLITRMKTRRKAHQ